ncbi:hypothetical protein Dimus_034154 [Dionaea muscipula]
MTISPPIISNTLDSPSYIIDWTLHLLHCYSEFSKHDINSFLFLYNSTLVANLASPTHYFIKLSIPSRALILKFSTSNGSTMHPNEVGLQYLIPSSTSTYPYFAGMACNTTISPYQTNGYFHIVPQVQDHNPQPSSLSSNSTSDEADEQQQQQHIINERKHRRMLSNRESARRSRMRKQRHLDELWSQVVWLRNENHQLMDKLSHATESHDRVLKENNLLKEQTSDLRQLLTDLQLNTTYSGLRDLEDIANALN